jgi:hypothetical protein
MSREVTKHRVAITTPKIGAKVGPFTVNITDVWIEYQGKKVTEVPQGERFNVRVSYDAENDLWQRFPDPFWSTCATVISTTDPDIKRADHDMTSTKTVHHDAKMPLTMPNHDITLRIKVFCNQSRWDMPGVPDWPPESAY